MKLTFELVTETDLTAFNELVNQRLAQGFRFVAGQPMTVVEYGKGFQYSIAMLLEEEA